MKAAEIEKTFCEIEGQLNALRVDAREWCVNLGKRVYDLEMKQGAAESRADELECRIDDCETDIHIKSCDGVQLSALLCLIPAKVDVKIIDTKRDTGYKPREDYTSSAEFMLRNGGLIVDRVTTTNGGILIEVF